MARRTPTRTRARTVAEISRARRSTPKAVATPADASSLAGTTDPIWLRSRRWDLTWIIGSCILILLPISIYGLFPDDRTRVALNLAVTLFVGGPHMYVTATRTAWEPRFRAARGTLMIAGAIAIPAIVITLSIHSYVLLLTLFFGWAGLHILHQAFYLTRCYGERGALAGRTGWRWLDYALIGSSLYPVALYKMVNGTFAIGPTKTIFPEFLRVPAVYIAAFALFAALFVLFTVRVIRDARAGRANWPKTCFVYATAIGSFSVSLFDNLDTSFQGFNTWHSLQYLALTWHIHRVRDQRGDLEGRFVRRLVQGRSMWPGYAMLVGMTLIAGGLVVLVKAGSGFSIDRSYYAVVLSFLLIHYFLDHFLFQSDEGALRGPADAFANRATGMVPRAR